MSIRIAQDNAFYPDLLRNMEWIIPGLVELVSRYRWAGYQLKDLHRLDAKFLNAILIPHDDGSINGTSTNRKKFWYIAIIAVQDKGAVNDLLRIFHLPIQILVNDGYQETGNVSHNGCFFSFKDGTVIELSILTNERLFWKVFLSSFTSKEFGNQFIKFIGIKIEQNSRSPRLRKISFSEIVEFKWLGDQNTTNVVFKLTVKNEKFHESWVIKYYPILTCNPTRIMSEKLVKNGFKNHARMLFTCEYSMDFLKELFNSVGMLDIFSEIDRIARENSFSGENLFPLLQGFEYIESDHDGGYPFWESALESKNSGSYFVISEELSELIQKLSGVVVQYHSSLNDSVDLGVDEKKLIYNRVIETVLDNFKKLGVMKIPGLINAVKIPDIKKILKDLVDQIKKISCDLGEDRLASTCSFDNFSRPVFQYLHHDLHLMQFAFNSLNKEFYILDLEGDPQSSWLEKFSKYPIEKDLASLMRSFSYIKFAAFKESVLNRNGVLDGRIKIFNLIFPLFFFDSSAAISTLSKNLLDTSKISVEFIRKRINQLQSWEQVITGAFLRHFSTYNEFNLGTYKLFYLKRVLDEILYEMKFRPEGLFTPILGLKEFIISGL
ncbi:MAG: hypothetical protein ACTSVI_15280 [Promethearchaeota archaeon]